MNHTFAPASSVLTQAVIINRLLRVPQVDARVPQVDGGEGRKMQLKGGEANVSKGGNSTRLIGFTF
jgi:hypothetical protein